MSSPWILPAKTKLKIIPPSEIGIEATLCKVDKVIENCEVKGREIVVTFSERVEGEKEIWIERMVNPSSTAPT